MKMPVSKALEIRLALQNCDGHQIVIEEGETKKAVFILHELGFNARFAIAKNLEELDRVNETYVKMRNDLIKSLAKNGNGIDPNTEQDKMAEFFAKDRVNLEESIEVSLEKLKKTELQKANLPVNVLATIMPIIQE
jgi:hypothetical protein